MSAKSAVAPSYAPTPTPPVIAAAAISFIAAGPTSGRPPEAMPVAPAAAPAPVAPPLAPPPANTSSSTATAATGARGGARSANAGRRRRIAASKS